MPAIRQILVGIRDPGAGTTLAVAKAAKLARAFAARLELFHALSAPVHPDIYRLQGLDLRGVRREYRSAAIIELEKSAERLRRLGVQAGASANWDYPPAEALVRRAERLKADLIVIGPHPGRHALGWLLGYTDWELLRLSPIPVLLVKSERPYGRRPRILAALDPAHAHEKPAKLDAEILRMARTLESALGARLHAVHAFVPLMLPGLGGSDPMAADISSQLLLDAGREAKAQFDAALATTEIPARRRHLVAAHPVEAIPGTARMTDAAVVVMGAVSRSGLGRIFIGNTAERVLDRLGCDVLVVKPPRFARRIPRASRGMRLAPPAGLP